MPAVGVDHYENFPVASILCPPALRPAIAAIYGFARTADDLADEGTADADTRLADLAAYRADLEAMLAERPTSARWPQVFGPLRAVQRRHALPPRLLRDLLSAFEQDVRNPPYPDRGALLDYCSRSANPVGRLLLHLYGVSGAREQQRSDAICTALQLINFWQDLGRDLRHGRNYLPAADLAAHGLRPDSALAGDNAARLRECVRELCRWAAGLMRDGAPLAWALPGRIGWELRLVVLGGLRVLEKIERIDGDTLHQRPTIGRGDVPLLLWRAFRPQALRSV
ncbi:MAG: squalene synthase HpnC [Proteobacteria bacterium]|nr:squalene synthase HpnC [Pseudomonadota bacterium]MCA0324237.1 squalene synthase HpnC [Pseudomonadota bacterium]